MKIKVIVIELEPETDDEKGHATTMRYDGRVWNISGAIFPRFAGVLMEIIKLVKGQR